MPALPEPSFHSALHILPALARVIRISKPKLLAVIGNRAIVSRKMQPMQKSRPGLKVCYNIYIGQSSRIMPKGFGISSSDEILFYASSGAKKDSWFSHIAIEVPGEETSNEWCEPVSDEVYDQLQ